MRARHSGWTTEDGKVLTHCTIDDDANEPQTAVTFRCSDYQLDIVTVTRPFPNSTNSSFDSANTVMWR